MEMPSAPRDVVEIKLDGDVSIVIRGVYRPPIPARAGNPATEASFEVWSVLASECGDEVDLVPLMERLEKALPRFDWMQWAEEQALDAISAREIDDHMERAVAGAGL